MHILCQLIIQVRLFLNLIEKSRINPKLLDYAQVHGTFYFNAIPVSPPKICVVGHEKPVVCGIWGIWGIDSRYLSQALHQYRCFQVFAKNTAHICIADIVKFYRINLLCLLYHQQTTPSNQKNNLHMTYSIQNQAHHSPILEIPPWCP